MGRGLKPLPYKKKKKEIKKMWYRLIYSDGSFGAWTKNYEWIKECADFFRAIIEEKKEEDF